MLHSNSHSRGQEGAESVRHDSLPGLMSPTKTADGFLIAEAYVTRPGVLVYRRADGSTVRELIPDEELRDPAVLASLGGKPVTLEHPGEGLVTPRNAGQVSVGSVLGEVESLEEGLIKVRIAVHRADALTHLEAWNQVSVGRTCRVDPTPGVHPKHGRYDAVQRGIRFNHLALTKAGRAGPDIAVRMDGADFAEECMLTLEERLDAFVNDETVRADGAGVLQLMQDAFEEMRGLKRRLEKADADSATGKAEMDKLKAEYDAKCGEYDAMKAKLDEMSKKADEASAGMEKAEEEKKGMAPKMDAAQELAFHNAWLAERAPLLDAAQRLKLDSVTDLDNAALRRALAAKIKPDLRADASDDYIAGLLATHATGTAGWDHISAALAKRTDSAPSPVTHSTIYGGAFQARENK